jgi:hypothetical protein
MLVLAVSLVEVALRQNDPDLQEVIVALVG